MISIFNYTDYREYLKDYIQECKTSRPSFSIRKLSQSAGIKSGGFLSMVINGKRNISLKIAGNIAAVLKFSKTEEKYFHLMVCYSRSKNIESKHDILGQMLSLTRSSMVQHLLPEQFAFYDNWYNPVIREIIEIAEVNEVNSPEIAKKLKPVIRSREFYQALQLLYRLKLIYKDSSGRYRRSNTIVTSGNNHFRPVVIGNFQSSMAKLAIDAMKKSDENNSEFSTLTLSIDENTWNLIKNRCAMFRRDLLNLASSSRYPDRVIEVNLQCFPVSDILSDTDKNNE